MATTPHRICPVTDLPPGTRKVVTLAGKSIGIFNVGGTFYALRNVCPHQFAPLCEGKVTGYAPPSAVGEYQWASPGAILRCPWHGWEFDITTGRSVFNPHRIRTQSLRVTVEPDLRCGHEHEDPTLETFVAEVDSRGWVVVHVEAR